MRVRLGLCLHLGEVCRGYYSHGRVDIVQCDNLLRDSLYPVVQVVQPLFALIHVFDDAIVDIGVRLFRLLERHKCAIEELHLVHLVGADVNSRFFHQTGLQLDG